MDFFCSPSNDNECPVITQANQQNENLYPAQRMAEGGGEGHVDSYCSACASVQQSSSSRSPSNLGVGTKAHIGHRYCASFLL